MSSPYRSFLLRFWLEPNDSPDWRAMLENSINGERHGFASLDALFHFIRQETERLEEETQTSQTHPYQGDLS